MVAIGRLQIGHEFPVRVIAEIGVNHQGDIDIALDMIRAAKAAGADLVKLQSRTPELSVPESEWDEIRDTPFGPMPKLAYRQRMEFGQTDYEKIDALCRSLETPWLVSVWDCPSVDRMEECGCVAYKIPSPRLHDLALIRRVRETTKPIILSTGMSTDHEVAIAMIQAGGTGCLYGPGPGVILMQCTSSYPSKAEECNLRVIQTYRNDYPDVPVGFSSHKIGIQTCLLAVAVGACIIERHFTFDRSLPGSDHKISSTPEDLARLVKEIRYAEACLGDGRKIVYPSEEPERKRLRGGK